MAPMVTEIWQQVHDGLRAAIAKRVDSDAEVDDILQEVFLRMHRGIDTLKDPACRILGVPDYAPCHHRSLPDGGAPPGNASRSGCRHGTCRSHASLDCHK